ncbi:MAG TPA: glycosyltransferase, partial [Ktedonobacterales bacterium]
MHIAQIAPLQVSVPPAGYGGTERCIYNLTEALIKLGHDVTLFATGDSRTSAKLVPGIPRAINFDVRVDAGAAYLEHIEAAYDQADQFDVIHSHVDYFTLPISQTTKTPTVITLHGRIDSPEFVRILRRYRTKTNFVAISHSQRQQIPDLNWVSTIHHAIDLERFEFYPEPGNYLAFVGRFSPEKCPDLAIEIAKRVGIPMIMAAKVDYKDQEYFDTVVKPLLKHPLIEYVGTVGEEEKQK